MKAEKSPSRKSLQRNEDPITGQPGAHPISTGVGAAGAGVVGIVVGSAIAGPVGGLVGAAVGGLVGGLSGSAVAETVDPSVTNDSLIGGTASSPIADIFNSNSGTTPDSTLVQADAEIRLANEPTHRDTIFHSQTAPAHHALRHEQIAARAWRIYEAEGFPEGRSEMHWAQAERELSMI